MELKQAEWYVHTRRFWLAQFESLLEREKKIITHTALSF